MGENSNLTNEGLLIGPLTKLAPDIGKKKKCDSGHTWRSGSGCHVYGGGTGTRALGSRNKSKFGPSLCPTVVDALVG